MFNGFHRSAIHYLLPSGYVSTFDKYTWYSSQFILWWHVFLYYRDSTLITSLQMNNWDHHNYPRNIFFLPTKQIYLHSVGGHFGIP
eukprot:UN09378